MDKIDYQILETIQRNFPLHENPYAVIAADLGISVDQLFTRIKALKHSGVIRRLGLSLDSRKLGYVSTLCAVSVKPDRLDQAAEFIGAFAEVTHSYQRDSEFNIWFTLITESKDSIKKILTQIQEHLDLTDAQIMDVPVEKLFKLDARFKVSGPTK